MKEWIEALCIVAPMVAIAVLAYNLIDRHLKVCDENEEKMRQIKVLQAEHLKNLIEIRDELNRSNSHGC